MPKLPVVSSADVIAALKQVGFTIVSQRGSHIKLQRIVEESTQTVIVPNHKEIKRGTLRNGILKPINLSVEEFIKLLQN